MPKIKDLSDEELVEYVRSEDQEQYREVVARYQDKLLRYARRLTNDEEMAQDVVQQAFVNALVNLHGFNVKKKFSSWIYRIVHNEAVNHLKRKRREVYMDPSLWENIGDSSVNGFEEMLEGQEGKELLGKCLEEMPVSYRAPLTLSYFEKRSYGEISDILRIPVGTVGTRINRGKKLLKQLFLRRARVNPFAN